MLEGCKSSSKLYIICFFHLFVQILPVVVFFSAVSSVLYYVGVMQVIIKAIAILLQIALNTTPIESFATAAHIFIGQVIGKLFSG